MISVIVITHNRESVILERAIKSVFDQTYKNIEVIVVNDSDKSFLGYKNVVEVVERFIKMYGSKIKYVEHDVAKGACAARNTGLEMAKGEYIAFLDDDDEWENRKLEKQLSVFENKKETNISFVYCGALFVYDNKEGVIEKFHPKYTSGNIFDKLLVDNFVLGASFPLIRTEYVRKIGGFDLSFPSCQDWDVWLQLSQLGEVYYVAEPLVKYHIHQGEQITKNYRKGVEGITRLLDKYKAYYETNNTAYYSILEKLLYQYAVNKELKETRKIVEEISNLKGITKILIIKLKIRVMKWIVFGGRKFGEG